MRALADECVMCGLCLPHCPTFRLHGDESRSPRGRIALARTLNADHVDDSVRQALESCLQCRACEAVCPAQVRYGEIIELARGVLNKGNSGKLPVLRWALGRPTLTATALSLGGRAARVWPALTRHLGRRARWLLRAAAPVAMRAQRPAPSVLFVGCVARSLDSDAHAALLQVAQRCDLDLTPLAHQSCCGALSRHVGASAEAEEMAARNTANWSRASSIDLVALDSACIAALRQATSRLRVIEACRWLLDRQASWVAQVRPLPQRIGLFMPCSHRNSVGDVSAPALLLALLPAVEVLPIATGFGCCGAAGPHVLMHSEQADALAQPIVDAICSMQLDAIATSNVGCAMHLAERLALRGITLPVRHPVAFLADRLLSEP